MLQSCLRQLSLLVFICLIVLLIIARLLRTLLLYLLQSLLQCLLLQYPVVHEVKVEAFPHEGLSEHLDDLLVVRSLLKLQLSRIVHKMLELAREAMGQVLYRCNCLFDFDLLILLFFGLGW